MIQQIPVDTSDSQDKDTTSDDTSSSTSDNSNTGSGVVTPGKAGPATKPTGFEVTEKPKRPPPKINVATGESEEATKKTVTLESYKPVDTIKIGGRDFDLPIKKEIIEDDSEPPPPLPERKVAPAEDVANLFSQFRESYLTKKKSLASGVNNALSTVSEAAGEIVTNTA